jgi:CheY-like chemotaxis protein
MRILIVDDSSMMRAMIKRVVKLTDVPVEEILEAGDARQALSILQSHDVHLLLTDINMPGMSGADLLRVIAADDRWRTLTRVVISTDGSAARREQVAELSVRCYLEKPFSPEVLRDVLAEASQAAGL